MKIAVRCLYYRAVTPNLLIINLEGDIWSRFLWGDKQTRKELLKPYIPKYHPYVREIVWIPLDGLSELAKSELIRNLY